MPCRSERSRSCLCLGPPFGRTTHDCPPSVQQRAGLELVNLLNY